MNAEQQRPPHRRGDEPPPASTGEALERAVEHARRAAAEAVAASRALLDAAAFAGTGAPSDELRFVASAATALDELRARLEGGASPTLFGAVLGALDAEIARWEERGREDRDARAVLRAFLGLREILWELGLRSSGPEPAEPEDAPAAARGARTGRSRLQRVPVEG